MGDSKKKSGLDESLMRHGFDYLFDPSVSVGGKFRQKQNRAREAGTNTTGNAGTEAGTSTGNDLVREEAEGEADDEVLVADIEESKDGAKDFNVTMGVRDERPS